jgi:hypothetical protein
MQCDHRSGRDEQKENADVAQRRRAIAQSRTPELKVQLV